MTKENPLVSVVLPAFNAESTIQSAIESILSQTYKFFELIVVDDGSVDATADIVRELSTSDKRIKLITQKNNGIVHALNTGLAQSSGRFLARMDADDLSCRTRLEKQVAYLLDNPETVLVGCNCYFWDGSKILRKTHVPVADASLKLFLLYESAFIHPSVMINRELAGDELVYKERWKFVEDLDLWFRLSNRGKFSCIDEYLFFYRINPVGISGKNGSIQKSLDFERRTLEYGNHSAIALRSLNGVRFERKVMRDWVAFVKLARSVSRQNNASKLFEVGLYFRVLRRSFLNLIKNA